VVRYETTLLARIAITGTVSLCERTKILRAFLELERVTRESLRFLNAD
jgi:hypothetical protein